jgi:glycosyltransferase involved in cell wall biosynthesis
MRHAFFVVPGALEALTGGSFYNRRSVEGLRRRGWTIDVLELQGCFPVPSDAHVSAAARAFADIPDCATTVVDGLVHGALPDVIERHQHRLRFAVILHMLLAEEFGIEESTARIRRVAEQRALAGARRIVATGQSTIDTLTAMGIGDDRVVLIEPGTDAAPIARGSSGGTIRLLCVAAVTPGKGYDMLLRALARLRMHAWTLTCVGSVTRNPAHARRVQSVVSGEGLSDRVSFAGELSGEALESCYAAADVFVLATQRETYGMAVAEAIAHGLPVVSVRTGAIPTLVTAGAGLLVEPDDERELTAALSRVLSDRTLRERLAAGALVARARLHDWESVAEQMAFVLESVARDG